MQQIAPRDIDPHGIDQHAPGAKLDAQKPRLGLVLGDFSNALVEVGKVGTYGANKYSDRGWLHVPNGIERYTDALYRHLLAIERTILRASYSMRHEQHGMPWRCLS